MAECNAEGQDCHWHPGHATSAPAFHTMFLCQGAMCDAAAVQRERCFGRLALKNGLSGCWLGLAGIGFPAAAAAALNMC